METQDAKSGAEAPEETSQGLVEEGAPSWTVTFGDMMSLLLTFFILLFSMSELKMEKFLLASQSLREAMGGTAEEVIDDPMGLMPDPVDPELNMQNPGPGQGAAAADGDGPGGAWLDNFAEAYLDVVEERFRDFIAENDLTSTVQVERDGEGVRLRMKTVTLFGSGDATVSPEGAEVLGSLSEITRGLDIGVVVSGHADNRPIRNSVFASNWELSAARAAGVARALVSRGHPPAKVRVESFGEFRPVATNDTPEGRSLNRRVELFYSRTDVTAAALYLLNEESADPLAGNDQVS